RIGSDDAVFDLEIAANRGDLMSHLGVARELAAATKSTVRLPSAEVARDRTAVSEFVRVEVREPDLCPRFTAAMLVDVRVAPSPEWLARHLEACDVRSINNIVDVTNYVMLEMGQPMHAFDYDRLHGGHLVIRPARSKEPLTTLDGVQRTLDPQTLLVADADQGAGIAGIIGGAPTEITTSTRRVLLEAAVWHPPMIRRTSKRLGVRTESSARFERGVDQAGVPSASTRALALMQQVAGGRALDGLIDVQARQIPTRQIAFNWSTVHRVLGTDVPIKEGVATLKSLGFQVEAKDSTVRVVVPSYRRDVEREEDLVEDIARHHGYDRIPEEMPVEVTAQGSWAPSIDAERAIRDTLIRAGLTEVLTVPLTNAAALDTLRLPDRHPFRDAVPIRNPMVEDHVLLRASLLPGLLHVARTNASHRSTDIQVFEVGRTFHPNREGAREERSLGVLMTGVTLRGAWNLPPESLRVTYYTLKGVMESLLGELRVAKAEFRATHAPWLHPGRAASLVLEGKTIGTLGELHPDVGRDLDLPEVTCIAEVDLQALLAHAVLQPRFVPPPRYPSVRRDISFVVDAGVPVAEVEAAIRRAGGGLLERAELFDIYTGTPVPEGRRNLAYALTFRSPDRTLTAEEISETMAAIARALEKGLRAKLRE
ncbi:MAG TPA: phenylalanine--tRNA ligase subunit beta, partial [bacterium]|nr:phenylalanine--tRNA ligase subunit beta [bacterium]